MSKSYRPNRSCGASGFSMVELLVALAIIAILAALVTPAITSMQSSYGLETTGQAVTAQLNTARQYALTTGHPVQVRFYKVADFKNTSNVYRAMQSFVEWDGAITPLNKPYFFSTPLVILQGTVGGVDISSLLTSSYSGITVSTTADAAHPLPPPYGTTYTYEYFHFRANGATDLNSGAATSSVLTLALETAPLKSNGLPSNYLTVQLNAVTGLVGMFRP